jgi:predicted component of type VI protein secretion system
MVEPESAHSAFTLHYSPFTIPMPFLRVSFDGSEIDRRDLNEAIVIGRSADSDLAVRDVLLSRRHCRVSPCGDGSWQAVDLASKNGTSHNGKALSAPAVLRDGDELALGRLTARFCAGTLAGANLTPLRAAPVRPADPNESLSGTCAGFGYLEPGQSPAVANFPRPRPSPRPPAAFERDDLYSLLSGIASSSWDSIYAEARRPLNTAAAPRDAAVSAVPVRRHRPRSPVDLSLQANHRGELNRRTRSGPRARRVAGSGAWLAIVLALFIFKLCASPRQIPAAAAAVAAPAPIAASTAAVNQNADFFVRVGVSVLTLVF